MSEFTAIEWCDATLNLWWGCTKVSEGCKHCYAEELSDQRYKKGAWGPKGIRTEVKGWRSTLNKISKRAKDEGRRLRVFCQSMSDTFEGPETCGGIESENWKTMQRLRTELWSAIWEHKELDFLILTKRPENIEFCVRGCNENYAVGFPDNVWLGTSVENQETADKRIPELLKIHSKVRFLSCEPLLGSVSLNGLQTFKFPGGERIDSLKGELQDVFGEMVGRTRAVSWVICGGESGANARPMHPEWARSLRDQCQSAEVPFFFKQWGVWVTENQSPDDIVLPGQGFMPFATGPDFEDGDQTVFFKVGKKSAGSLLDGQEWKQFPGGGQ